MKHYDVAQQSADVAAGVSLGSAGLYFVDVLEPIALVIAILSGSAALGWHIYRAYREYQFRTGETSATSKSTGSEFTGKKKGPS